MKRVGAIFLMMAAVLLPGDGAHARSRVSLAPIGRDAHGEALYLTYDDAKEYCADRGMRLPTIQELASALNPKGVSKSPKEGFNKISPQDEAPFYYTYQGYEAPPWDEAHPLWSSSMLVIYVHRAYVFNAMYGNLSWAHFPYERVPVRCAG
jgi:hypothetical protein